MIKRFIKENVLKKHEIHKHKYLRYFGKLLHNPYLWHWHRRSVAKAFAVGLFSAFIPLPFQMILATIIAIPMRANVPISIALVWITNPLTMPPIFYFAYKVGAFVLNLKPMVFKPEYSFTWLMDQLNIIWQPLILGSLICGIISAILGYLLVRIVWRIWLVKRWRNRNLAKT